jgi:hypothetical protein
MCGIFHSTPIISLSTVTTAKWRFTAIHMLQTVAQYGGREGQFWAPNRLYSEKTLSRKLFGIWHMYIYTFLLRMTDIITSQNTNPSSWDTCIYVRVTGPSYGTHPAEYDAVQSVSEGVEWNYKIFNRTLDLRFPGGYSEECGFLGCKAV